MEKLLNVLKEKSKEHIELMSAVGYNDSEEELRKTYIVENLFGITTYDNGLAVKFNDTIVEVMKVVYNGENFDYIKDDLNYIKFILVANKLDEFKFINWGTSIRGCWLETGNRVKIPELGDEEFIIEGSDKDFIKLIEWFECKDLKDKTNDEK